MALTPDQRAMLELVLERGQSYEQIAELLGVEVPEVRKRARVALTEIGGADPDEHVGLTDYLLGQADPIGRADAVRHLKRDSDSRELAQKVATQLRLIAPGAELPQLAGAAPAATPKSKATAKSDEEPGKPKRRGFFSSLESRQRQLIVILCALLVLVVAVVLGVSGVFGGDDSPPQEESQAQEGLTRVELQAPQGQAGTGIAVFARLGDQPVLQVNAADLTPTPKGKIYVIWLVNSDQQAYPLAREQVGANGNLSGPAPIPNPVVSVLPTFRFVDISLTAPAELGRAIQRAQKSGGPLVPYTGTSVLRGAIPTAVRTDNPEG